MLVLMLIASLLLGSLQQEQQPDVTAHQLQARQVRELVRVFGRQLQHVTLLGPANLLEAQMKEHYGPYVDDQLLAAWLAEPGIAPGRATSSPWPQRIEVDEVTSVGEEVFLVRGEIVSVTSVELAAGSDATAATQPVRLRVEREEGPWQITEFVLTEAQGSAPDRPTTPPAGERVSLTGEIVCLPKKGDGPITLECALGLEGEDGEQYGLDSLPQEVWRPGSLGSGSLVTVEGVLRPPPPDTTYAIAGVIEVDRITPQEEQQDDRNPAETSASDTSGLVTIHPLVGFALATNHDELPPAVIPPCPFGFELCAYLESDALEGTNFVSAGLAVLVHDWERQECESTRGNFPTVRGRHLETVGGTRYLVFETGEAGMSKVANDTVYRTWQAGRCIEFVSRIATTNMGVYPHGAVEEFTTEQQEALRERLEEIVRTAEFPAEE